MSRTIKFRVWDNNFKYMNYKVIVGIYGDWEEVEYDENYTSCAMWIEPKYVDYKCEPHWTHFEPYHENVKLMQYTGLKDKNGVEIYEGDIVKVDGSGNNDAEINEVVFYRGTFCFTDRKKLYPLFTGLNYCCEVIGNIYENPELIKECEE